MDWRRTADLVWLALALVPVPAFGFTIDTPLSHGCHERMTLIAIEDAGWPGGRTASPLDETERRVLADLPFEIPSASHDAWTLALLIGVRHNDLRGAAPSDLPGLSELHSDPDLQTEHCLRGRADDGPEGDLSALLGCRAFILGELSLALGTGDVIDLDAATVAEVNLAFRGEFVVPVRRFAFHLGRALHALQDSYSHTFRAPGAGRVRHVLNFIDHGRESDYVESRDGHRHLRELDDCGDDASLAPDRAQAAKQASIRLLTALAPDEGGRAGRIARAEAVLDEALGLEPGCTHEDLWCNAPELALVHSCACRGVSVKRRAPWPGLLLLILLAGWFGRRRRVPVTLALLAVLSIGDSANAAEVRTSTNAAGSVGIYVSTSASIDRGAFAVTGALRWRAFEAVSLGLDVEYNPWFSIDAARFAPGVFNVYTTAIYHWVSFESLELNSRGHLGTSVLLFDLPGADAGSAGLYVGLSLLGLSVRLDDHVQLVFEPADLSFPIPHLRGVPFYYRQYRVTLGVQWNP